MPKWSDPESELNSLTILLRTSALVRPSNRRKGNFWRTQYRCKRFSVDVKFETIMTRSWVYLRIDDRIRCRTRNLPLRRHGSIDAVYVWSMVSVTFTNAWSFAPGLRARSSASGKISSGELHNWRKSVIYGRYVWLSPSSNWWLTYSENIPYMTFWMGVMVQKSAISCLGGRYCFKISAVRRNIIPLVITISALFRFLPSSSVSSVQYCCRLRMIGSSNMRLKTLYWSKRPGYTKSTMV